MSFDIEPDGDPHGECALEIHNLQKVIADKDKAILFLEKERKEWMSESIGWADKTVSYHVMLGKLRDTLQLYAQGEDAGFPYAQEMLDELKVWEKEQKND